MKRQAGLYFMTEREICRYEFPLYYVLRAEIDTFHARTSCVHCIRFTRGSMASVCHPSLRFEPVSVISRTAAGAGAAPYISRLYLPTALFSLSLSLTRARPAGNLSFYWGH